LTATVEARVFAQTQGMAYHTADVFENRLLMFGGETKSKYSTAELFFINLEG